MDIPDIGAEDDVELEGLQDEERIVLAKSPSLYALPATTRPPAVNWTTIFKSAVFPPESQSVAITVTDYLYIVLGIATLLPNIAICFSILHNSKLRQRNELIVLAVTAIGELLTGLALVARGFRFVMLNTLFNGEMTRLECMCLFSTGMILFAAELRALIMVAVSVDRVLCVWSFMRYREFGCRYLTILLGTPFAMSLGSYLTAWGLVLAEAPQARVESPACYTRYLFPDWFIIYHSTVQIVASVASVLLYGAVIAYARYGPKSALPAIYERQERRQKKMTKLFAIMAATTVVIFIIPNVIMAILLAHKRVAQKQMLLLKLMILTKAGHSVFYITSYLLKPSDVRSEIVRLFCPCCLRCGKASSGNTPLRRDSDDIDKS